MKNLRCNVNNCQNLSRHRGMCKKHYMRQYRHGDVNYKPKSARERFWDRVDKSGDCWEWLGAVSNSGYGAACIDANQISAHRAAYMLHYGSIPKGMCVCHKCDNKTCVNPEHLFTGTMKDNMLDKAAKGRHYRTQGINHWKSKMTNTCVRRIREAVLFGAAIVDLAHVYDVHTSTVHKIVTRETWKHVG